MSLKSWLRNKLAGFILGGDDEEPEALPAPTDRVEAAPEAASLLGPEAESMLAQSKGFYPEVKPPPPLEGSADERRARLKLR